MASPGGSPPLSFGQKNVGKKATKGQKQIHDENKSTVKFYGCLATVFVAIHLTARSALLTTSSAEWVYFVLSVLSQIVAIFMMKYMAKETKGDRGQIVDAGLDLNIEGGFGEYCKDVVILTSIVQFVSLFTSYGWWFLFLMPAFALYKLWTSVLAPWFFAPAPPGGDDDDPDEERRQRRRDRRATKRL